jgi:phenylalanyl-tRNA synthetase alpha chain
VASTAERLKSFELDSMSNVSSSIISKLDRRLFANSNHPIGIVKELIWKYFKQFKDVNEEGFKCFDHFNPIVSVKQNFDALCFPPHHVGRSSSDSYFINNKNLLRTHMTANEPEYIKAGHRAFLIAGDVYRRDEIDATHYPVFHQLEGVRIFEEKSIPKFFKTDSPFDRHVGVRFDYETQYGQDKIALRHVTDDLYYKLNGLMRFLFGEKIPIRWQTCFFPFTSPSFEIEIQYRDRWVEVCGSGVLQQSILKDCDAPVHGWAFGLGLERLAMILFDIPDIRIFWSQDERFLTQFQAGKISKFIPFSKYPLSYRDMSFWVNEDFEANSLFDLIRQSAGDLVEDVKLVKTLV